MTETTMRPAAPAAPAAALTPDGHAAFATVLRLAEAWLTTAQHGREAGAAAVATARAELARLAPGVADA